MNLTKSRVHFDRRTIMVQPGDGKAFKLIGVNKIRRNMKYTVQSTEDGTDG